MVNADDRGTGRPSSKSTWDLRTLAAADELTDERAKEYHRSLDMKGSGLFVVLCATDRAGRPGRVRAENGR